MPRNAADKWRHTSTNALWVAAVLPVQLPMSVLIVMVANWTNQHGWGLVYLLSNHEQPIIKYGLMFIVLDFLDWVYHISMHKIRPFWRFHKLHHGDRTVDVSTTVREHPGETFIRNCYLMFWAFLCGASVEILILRQTAETISNLYSHSEVRLPEPMARILAWLFITPNLHHVHHHQDLPNTDRNYGDVFSLWDRLFGTLAHVERRHIVFGLRPRTADRGEIAPGYIGRHDLTDTLLETQANLLPS